MTKYTARIVFAASGRGLLKDAQLIEQVLVSAGWQPELVKIPRPPDRYFQFRSLLDRFKSRLSPRLKGLVIRLQLVGYRLWGLPLNRVLLTIHLENVYARYVPAGARHWLIPNPEWIRPGALQYLKLMDHIVCKTRDAQQRFNTLHGSVRYSGFSGDYAAGENQRAMDYRRFLHVAGNSRLKGTAALISLWCRHPEWPVLDVVIDERSRLEAIPANVRVHECIDSNALNTLRETCGIVLAPSESEGFGHVILEGMAYGGVVVTVDAPPMHELVNSERGYLVSCAHTGQCRLGDSFRIDQDHLEKTISRILTEEPQVLNRLSSNALRWVAENHHQFIQRFQQYLQEELTES
ncbi:MAG: glycosyltransferase [Halomonadaceae bacterium]|nr:MAG: glycosyltransferase [Halomonadaceae bacterium]